MTYKDYEEVFLQRADELEKSDKLIALAYKLYAYELFSENQGAEPDMDRIKGMVESTSHIIEDLYHSFDLEDMQFTEENLNQVIYDTSVFAAIMTLASRVYEVLDPVFSRDLIHAALDAGHFLMVGQFKTKEDDDKEVPERISIMRMGSNDDKLDKSSLEAQMWAFSELLRTDKDVRNAYDHSLMAGMPQKMSRQKRYRIRLSELFGKVSDGGEESDLKLFSMLAMLIDEEENAPEEIRKNMTDKLIDATGSFSKVYAVVAVLALKVVLLMNEKLSGGDSQLIKVIEYNVINNNKKKLSDDEINVIRGSIDHYEEMIKI